MNYKNENFINRNLYPYNKSRSFRKSFMEKFNKQINEGFDFRRTTSSCVLNTDGEKPLILYIKSPEKINSILEKQILDTKFGILEQMTDGGLKQKYKKFFNLLPNYHMNYNFHSPIKQKKEILKDLKNKKYNSLSFSPKKLIKNKTTIEYPNDAEESNIYSKTSRDKMIKKSLYNKIKNNKESKSENNKNNIINDNKNIKLGSFYRKNLIKSLIKNFKVMNISKKEISPNSILFEKKKQILEKNGIDLTSINIQNGILKIENTEEEEKNNNKKTKNIKILKNRHLVKLKSDYNIQNEEINKRNKPIIDQFEYIRKIFKAHKKLPYSSIKINNFFKKNNKKNQNNNIQSNTESNKIRNIQTKNYIKNNNLNKDNDEQEKIKNENLNTKISEETSDEYPFAHRKNHRKHDELKYFIKLKRKKERKKSKENELEKKRKLYIKFKNLCKLNLENINFDRFKNNNLKNHIKKRNEINKYNTQNEVSKSSSTLVEKNDYYMALYQSQQVITNSNIDTRKMMLEKPSLKKNLIYNKFNKDNDKIKNILIDKKKDIYKPEIINNFIKIIKLFFKRKAFIKLLQNLSDIKYYYNYYLAIKSLIALIKLYPFRKLYLDYIFKKESLYNKDNIDYLVEVISLIFKIKVFEKLFNYSKQEEMKIVNDKLEKLFKLLTKPHINNIFQIFKNISLNKNKDNNNINKKNNLNEINQNINDNKDNNDFNMNINNNISNNFENKEIKNINNDLNINKELEIIKKIKEKKNINNNDKKNRNIDLNNDINNPLIFVKIENDEDSNNEKIKNDIKKEKKDKNNNSNREKKEKDQLEDNKDNINLNNIIIEDEKSENDISAERETIKDIDWNYVCSDNLKEDKKEIIINKNKEDIKINDKGESNSDINGKKENESDEYNEEFQDIKSNKENSDIINDNKESEDKNKNKIIVLNKNLINSKNDKKINEFPKIKLINIDKNIYDINEKKEIISNNINNEDKKEKNKDKDNFNNIIKSIENPNKIADDLTEEIIKYICDSEVLSPKIKLIPNKSFKIEINNLKNENNDDNSLGLIDNDPISNDDSKLSMNSSLLFSSSTYSIFNKTIKDKKAENSINLYMDKIVPKLIRLIYKELIKKYKRIYDNISTPLTNNSKNIMVSLVLKNEKMFKDNYKIKIFKENLEDIIDKKDLLKKFQQINNEIRIKDNILTDDYYDKMINECIIDTTIEIIDKERLYFEEGEPLLWGEPRYESKNKFDFRNNPKKFSLYICKSLVTLLNRKLGLLKDKDNILLYEKINFEKEKRLNNMIKEQMNELDKEWNNLEIEETRSKLEAADYILEMLLRENIEILEHIQLNRRSPELYNYKSIYGFPNMPKLEFQKKESNNYFDDDSDDLINI